MDSKHGLISPVSKGDEIRKFERSTSLREMMIFSNKEDIEMSGLRDTLKAIGYDQEEAYFYQKDRELIETMRKSEKIDPSPPQELAKVIELRPGIANQPPVMQKKVA